MNWQKSFKILDKIGADDSIIGAVKRNPTRRGVDIAKETAQEVAQEGCYYCWHANRQQDRRW